ALQCRQNQAEVKPLPVAGASRGCGLAINNSASEDCVLTLAAAREVLRRKFVFYEADLKLECQLGQDAVLSRLLKGPAEFDVNRSSNVQKQRCGLLLMLMLALCSTSRTITSAAFGLQAIGCI
uniref:Transmembrane protein n=1 Tax=Macrostomum lignano TaxID=282301 RepID=A0A1I8JHC4_9PLAT